MPTERDIWQEGFVAGYQAAAEQIAMGDRLALTPHGLNLGMKTKENIHFKGVPDVFLTEKLTWSPKSRSPKKRKLSAWQKFVKANSKKKKYIYQSGAKRGKLNLKKMGVDYRKKKR